MFSVEVSPAVWIGLAAIAVAFLNWRSGGRLLSGLKSLLSPQPTSVIPLPSQAASAVAVAVPEPVPVPDRVAAASLLQRHFEQAKCAEGLAAVDTVFKHLLDDHRSHNEQTNGTQ